MIRDIDLSRGLRRFLLASLALCLCSLSRSAGAVDPRCDSDPGTQPPIPQVAPIDASVVFIREDCCTLPDAQRAYCFDDRFATSKGVLHDLSQWLGWDGVRYTLPGVRRPLETSPLLVDIGEGDFAGLLGCFDPTPYEPTGVHGFTSFRGAGRTKTILRASSDASLSGDMVFQISGCDQVSVSDLTMRGIDDNTDVGLVSSRSNSTWHRVDVHGFWYEWDTCQTYIRKDANGNNIGIEFPTKHVWTDSTFTTRSSWIAIEAPARNPLGWDNGVVYSSVCDNTEFYGGSITLHVPAQSNPAGSFYAGVAVAGPVRFDAYDTRIEVIADAARPPVNGGFENGAAGLAAVLTDAFTGLQVGPDSLVVPEDPNNPLRPPDGGTVELIGGEVIVDASAIANQSASALFASTYGAVETRGTKFTVRAAAGSAARRVAGSGRFDSPEFRQTESCRPFASTSAPGALLSLSGQDVFLEAGCTASGTCDGTGTQKHLMVYDSSCPSANPWRNQTTGGCRVSNPSASTVDDDFDGVPNVADNCVCLANPQITPLSFQLTTGGQLDDDQDGYGNRCDGDFNNDGAIDFVDQQEFTPSMNKQRSGTNCGSASAGATKCSIFDLDGAGTLIGSSDLTALRGLGLEPGARCDACPLP